MKAYRTASRISPTTAPGRPPVNASANWKTALNSSSHPTIIVTAAPAVIGTPIAVTPGALINILITIDQVDADFTSLVNSLTRSDILSAMSPSFFYATIAAIVASVTSEPPQEQEQVPIEVARHI